ncbi:prevent-host-death family protein [Hyphomicrobium denitrificans 1NES1]|uniref:Antitoxin n=1 Tax=Hyphomicrobium denitrificans 1NES1 TaxID=670307 RepID=N0B942_9HYPH|nr:type II toxin-antitoxin system Phd/YefM family antitoxin [Hyphomicrobium denitrificans]AGK59548.1 prevent-host-death family protein [Hyphomicrobium denitrificans 1NES1]
MNLATYTVSEARDNLAEVIDRVAYTEQPAVITKHGKDKVAVVPYRLLEVIARVEAMLDLDKARAALEDFESNGGMSLADLKKDLGLAEKHSIGGKVGKLPRSLSKGRSPRAKKVSA